jgi:hypothetical protein
LNILWKNVIQMDRPAYVYVYSTYLPYYKCVYVFAAINMHLFIYLFIKSGWVCTLPSSPAWDNFSIIKNVRQKVAVATLCIL